MKNDTFKHDEQNKPSLEVVTGLADVIPIARVSKIDEAALESSFANHPAGRLRRAQSLKGAGVTLRLIESKQPEN